MRSFYEKTNPQIVCLTVAEFNGCRIEAGVKMGFEIRHI